MYENGVNVTFELVDDEEDSSTFGQFVGDLDTVHLPGWCAGDAQTAVALYLFGHYTYRDLVRIVDWEVAE